MPILTKKLNSSKSLAPGGVAINTLVKNVLSAIEVKVGSNSR